MNPNINLFFYGIGANAVQLFGLTIGLVGFVGAIIYSYWMLILGFVGFAIAIYGKAMRFNYQRQSGHIIHGGDNFIR